MSTFRGSGPTAVAGITPMLPGLSIYRGMYAALNEQTLLGFTNVAMALSICCSLAAGVVLGEWVARRIRRPQSFKPYTAFRRSQRYSFRQAQLAAQRRAQDEAEERADRRRRFAKGRLSMPSPSKRKRGF
nr:amino acid export carrier protein [Corynebacterium diphtheriae]